MKAIFVIKQTDQNAMVLSPEFMESFARGMRKFVEDGKSMPIICLPYGFELQVIRLDGEGPEEVTVRYEDKNGNEIARPMVWK